jgi:hypothetical protein
MISSKKYIFVSLVENISGKVEKLLKLKRQRGYKSKRAEENCNQIRQIREE